MLTPTTKPPRLERDGPYWRAVFTDRTGRRRRCGIGKGTRQEAEDRLQQVAGTGFGGRRTALRTLSGRYLDARRNEIEPSTLRSHQQVLELLERFAGPVAASDVKPALAAAFVAKLGDRLATNTVRKHVRNLRAIWRWAILQGDADSSPWLAVKAAHVAVDRDVAFVDLATTDRMLAATRGQDDLRMLITLTRLVGLRVGEARRIRFSDIAGGTVSVAHVGPRTTKRRARLVPLAERAADELAFGSPGRVGGGLVCRVSDPYRSLLGLQNKLNLDPWPQPYHTLRASCETDWIRQGNALADVAAWMGHDPAIALRHYHRPTMQLKESAHG